MGIFGADQSENIESLKSLLLESEGKRKMLAETLAGERKRSAGLVLEVEKMKVELARAQQKVEKARQRQKASVERANRFKSRLEEISQAQVL